MNWEPSGFAKRAAYLHRLINYRLPTPWSLAVGYFSVLGPYYLCWCRSAQSTSRVPPWDLITPYKSIRLPFLSNINATVLWSGPCGGRSKGMEQPDSSASCVVVTKITVSCVNIREFDWGRLHRFVHMLIDYVLIFLICLNTVFYLFVAMRAYFAGRGVIIGMSALILNHCSRCSRPHSPPFYPG